MSQRKKAMDSARLDQAVKAAREDHDRRLRGFRDQALKLFPWICARCGREFDRGNLRELTVHHKDHDHDNNPPDGSNWELLCLFCHDQEHDHRASAKKQKAGRTQTATYKPFEGLEGLLKGKK